MSYQYELDVALEAVRKACKVCTTIRGSDACEDAISKKDRSPVTIADFGSQSIIIKELLANFSDLRVVAEEDSAQMEELKGTELGRQMVEAVAAQAPGATWESILEWVSKGDDEGGAEGCFWTIDPIDGTKGFIRNQQYAIALALIEDGIPRLGVLGCPNYPVHGFESEGSEVGMLFFATEAEGAFRLPLTAKADADPVEINVSDLDSPSEARLCESVESGHSSHSDSEKVAQALGVHEEPLRIDSQCKYAAVANGDASIYLRLPTSDTYREKIWDHAAGWMVTTEAGGSVTDMHGNKLDFSKGVKLEDNQGIVAAPESIQGAVITALNS